MRKFWFWMAVAAAGTVLAESGDVELVERKASPWHMTIGPVLAPRVRVRIHSPRPVLPAPVRPGAGASGSSGNVAADPSAGYADRQYVDGYVKPDEGTEDPDSMISGLTWNWGAKNVGSQYSGGKMEFHTGVARWDETISASSHSAGSGNGSDRDALLGLEAKGGFTFFENDVFDAAVDAGFRYYGSGDLNAESKYGTSVTTTRNQYRYVDSYSASGWTDVPSGSHAGTPGGPGRLLGATPTRREELAASSGSTETYKYYGRTKLNYSIWDLRLGPTLGWQVADYLTLRGGVYGLLGLVDAKLKSSMETADGAYGVKKSTCAGVFGMAAGLSAQINLTEDLYLVGGAEYDWWSDAIHMKSRGADARIKLSDFTVSLSLGMDF